MDIALRRHPERDRVNLVGKTFWNDRDLCRNVRVAAKALRKWAIYLALFVLALRLNDWVALWVSIQVMSGIAEFAIRVIVAALISLALGILPFMRTEEFTYARGFIVGLRKR